MLFQLTECLNVSYFRVINDNIPGNYLSLFINQSLVFIHLGLSPGVQEASA